MAWTFEEALEQHMEAKAAQEATGEEIRRAYREWARKKRLADVALARRVWELKREGIAVTACETLAKGDEEVAQLREDANSTEGLKESAKTAAWAANRDREEIAELIRWSRARDFAENPA